MDALYGYSLYCISLLTMGGIYAVLCLGLNVQWGFAGLFNAGIGGFFAIGAYVTALLTTAPSARHIGGFEVNALIAYGLSMVAAALVAWGVGKVCLRLRSDYLAIATIGAAEVVRLIFKNEADYTNGPRGVSAIPKPFETLPEPWNHIAFLAIVLAAVGLAFWALQNAQRAPWGRVMTAIRENEPAVRAAGKDVEQFRMEGFVVGAMLMGLAGALMAQYLKFVDPNVSDPLTATFLVWVMLVVGGSANNKGAVLGALLIWTLWSASEIVTGRLPDDWAVRTAYVRIFLIGLVLQIFLQKYPLGIFPEQRPKSPLSAREAGQ